MEDDFEKMADYVKKCRPVEFQAIVRHGNAISEILIEFWFDGMMGQNQHRVYEVRRDLKGMYHSSVSGGQEQWTEDKVGPNGEPILEWREWLVSERGGYIGRFDGLEDIAVMILHQLRGRDIYVVSDAEVFA